MANDHTQNMQGKRNGNVQNRTDVHTTDEYRIKRTFNEGTLDKMNKQDKQKLILAQTIHVN